MTTGRRLRTRRRIAVAGSTGALAVLTATLALALIPGQDDARHAPQAAGTPVGSVMASATASAPADPSGGAGLTTRTLPGLIERDLDIQLSDVDVSVLPPVHDLDLGAGLASAKGQYLNVQVTPAGTESQALPRCSDLEGRGSDSDFYAGQCVVRPLPDGGYEVLRTGRTADGTYAKTEATLVTGDGAGISAEATNQRFVGHPARTSSTRPRAHHFAADPVVSHDPPLTAVQLRRLVLMLQSQR